VGLVERRGHLISAPRRRPAARPEGALAIAGHNGWEGATMGDKGGKKDKEKSKQQQEKRQEQKKQDKARPRTA
jgi:hypothetical protein